MGLIPSWILIFFFSLRWTVFVNTFTYIWQLLYAVSKSFRDADMLDFKNSYLHKRLP